MVQMENKKILLVDDEADFLKVMGMRIEEWGFYLLKARSGKEAVDTLLSKNPDIIILDYLMPDMNGLQTLKEIRKFNLKIPVIMFTAHPEKTSVKMSEELGIIAFVPKLSAYADTQSALKEALRIAEKQLEKKE
jgi:CheY-like chemotaxis protein